MGAMEAIARRQVPGGLCPEGPRRTREPAGRMDPDSSLLLWFSFWPSIRHSPAHTPSHMLLEVQIKHVSGHPRGGGGCAIPIPGMFLEPGLGVNPLAWLTSTSS